MIRFTVYEVHSRERTRYAVTLHGAERLAASARGVVMMVRTTVEATSLPRLICAILNGEKWASRHEVIGLHSSRTRQRLALVRGQEK